MECIQGTWYSVQNLMICHNTASIVSSLRRLGNSYRDGKGCLCRQYLLHIYRVGFTVNCLHGTAVSSTIDLQKRRGRRKYRRHPQLGVRGEWVRVSRSVDKLSLRHPCFILLYLHASWLITTAFVPCMHCSWVVGHEIDFSRCRLLSASEEFPGKELDIFSIQD